MGLKKTSGVRGVVRSLLVNLQAAIHSGDSDSEGGAVCHPVCAGGADHHGRKKTQGSCSSSGTATPQMPQNIHYSIINNDRTCSSFL